MRTPDTPKTGTFAVTSTFVALAVFLAGLVAGYWIVVLQPRLKTEAVSQAEILARSQSNFIAEALAAGEGRERVHRVASALDELLLLRDAKSGTPYFETINLKIDYDTVRAPKGSLDLKRGSGSARGFKVDVALYDRDTYELLGIATFRVSAALFEQLSSDVRHELVIVSLAVLALLVAVWAVLVMLLHKSHKERLERDRAERELMEQEQRYHRLVSSLSTYFVYRRDAAGRFLGVSDAAARLFALSASELLPRLQAAKISHSSTTSHERSFEIEVEGGDGVLHHVELSEVQSFDDEGRLEAYEGIGHDVTAQRDVQEELRQAKNEAEEANRAKSHFLANMSHEIRTPLNAILGMAALAVKHDPSPKVAQYIEKIRSSARLLAELIEDILDLSRIEAGRLEIERVEFDLDELLSDLSDVVGVRAGQKNLEILFNTAAEVPRRLRGDPVRLKQVLLNLLNNALKFTTSGEIVVEIAPTELRRERAEIRFSVRDTGIGIAPENLATLFEPFTQVDTSSTRRFGGLGLGLAISHRLVRIMGGEMQVESVPGEGSTFSFTAPFDVPRGAVGARRLADEFRDLPVLVADDNASARAVLANMLRSLSCKVTVVNDGEEAMQEALRAQRDGAPYRLALLDWKMPGLDGAAVAERLTRSGELKNKLPVILVTAYDREYATQRGREVGIDAVLHKPVSPSMLHDAVVEVLEPSDRRHRTAERPAPVQFAPGKRILLVEDNEINRQVARELLSLAGLEVTEAHDGYQALDRLADDTFDAVLMDVQMPELDGIETVKAIRTQEHLKELPVIAMTAHAMLGDRERFLECGMSDYIAKPIEEEQLLTVLSRWVNVAPRAAASASSQLPQSLPGLLLEDGIRRTSGNVDLYRRLLVEFRRDIDALLPRMKDALSRGATRELLDLLHTLKGSAATLGANRVAEQCATLEIRSRAGDAVTLDLLTVLLGEVSASIATLSGGQAILPVRSSSTSVPLLPIARKLDEQLANNNLAAVSCFEELKAAAGPRFGDDLRRLEQSLDRLDFDGARLHLRTITEEVR